jgi:hypothetical protein
MNVLYLTPILALHCTANKVFLQAKMYVRQCISIHDYATLEMFCDLAIIIVGCQGVLR